MAPTTRNSASNLEEQGEGSQQQGPQLMDVLQSMNAMMQQQAMAQAQDAARRHEDSKVRLLHEFHRMNPPNFSKVSGTDLLEPYHWLKEIRRTLDSMGIVEEDRVRLATYQLKDEALTWWEATQRNLEEGAPDITWTAFQDLFLDKFFSEESKDKLITEFMRLEQRKMTVAEYESRFDELSQFAPHMIGTERMKAKRFEDGLRCEIRSAVVSHLLTSYSDVVKRASRVEAEQASRQEILGKLECADSIENQRNVVPVQPKFKCFRCGESDHCVAQCSMLPKSQQRQQEQGQQMSAFTKEKGSVEVSVQPKYKCFRCGKMGHCVAQCPMPPKSQQRQQRQKSQAHA